MESTAEFIALICELFIYAGIIGVAAGALYALLTER